MNNIVKADTNKLSGQLAAQGAKQTTNAKKGVQELLVTWKAQHAEKLYALARDRDSAEQIFTICLDTISKNPSLMKCSFETISSCIFKCIQFNLSPSLGECAFVPLRNGKLSSDTTDVYDSNFWLMYPGLVKLIMNAGNKAIITRVVRQGDYFEFHEGFQPPKFIPAIVLGKLRGERLYTYSAVCNRQGLWQVEVMSPKQIEVIKSRSMGAKKSDSPWNSKFEDDVDAMWQKTVLKRGSKWISKSTSLMEAIAIDNQSDSNPNLILSNLDNGQITVPFSVPENEGDNEQKEPLQLNENLGQQANLFEQEEGVKIPVEKNKSTVAS